MKLQSINQVIRVWLIMGILKIAVAGDVHLREHTWAARPNLFGDSYYSLDQIRRYCVKNSLPLILAGDTFQTSKPTAEDVEWFRDVADDFEQKGLPIYYIQGQHDRAVPPWPSAVHSWPVSIDNNRVKLNDVSIMGFDNKDSIDLQIALDNMVEPVDILVLHQMAYDVFPHDGAWNFKLEWVKDKAKIVALGDYHEPVTFGQNPVGFYTGSMHLQSLSEPTTKSFVVLEYDSSKPAECTINRIPLVTRQFFTCNISSSEDVERISEVIKKVDIKLLPGWRDMETSKRKSYFDTILRVPIFVINYSPDVSGVEATIRSLCQDKYHLWFVPTAADSKVDNTALKKIDPTNVLVSCVERYADKDTDKYKLSIDLLSQTSGQEVLNKWREKYGVVNDNNIEVDGGKLVSA